MPAPMPRLALLGAGRTASTVARALQGAGFPIAGLTCSSAASAARASEFLGGVATFASNLAAAQAAEVCLIGVPDREIHAVALELRAAGRALEGRVALHLAGALDSGALAPLRSCGVAVGSLHPLQTFPLRIDAEAYLRGVAFGIEGDPPAVEVARRLVEAVGGYPLSIASGAKPLYHAAASISANFTTTLFDLALRLMRRAGVARRQEATRALLPLMLTTLASVEQHGPADALTGPVARGDTETVDQHLERLCGVDRAVYRDLARATVELAARAHDAGRQSAASDHHWPATLESRPAAVVLSLRGSTVAELRSHHRESALADLVEYRLDTLADPQRADLAPLAGARSILTCHVSAPLDTEAAQALRRRALALPEGLVDIPLGNEEGLPLDRVVLSWHGPAEEAEKAARDIATRRPGVGKVAFTARDVDDILRIPGLVAVLRQGCKRICVLAMGEQGQASRVLAARLGSDWTYASRTLAEATAPGQLSIDELLERFAQGSIGRATRVFGLVGLPIAHSRSPDMLGPILRERLHDAAYVLLPTRSAEAAIRLVRELPLEGLSVTMPLKEAMARGVDRLTEVAQATRSVNCVVRRGRILLGDNTDARGVARVAEGLVPLGKSRVLILGAGGSARSAAWGLRERGARVTLVSRSPERARAAAERLGVDAAASPGEVEWDLLVNATPLGMRPLDDDTPLAAESLGGKAVIDLVYDPLETRLLREARARGLRVATGLEVLLAQGALQVEIFTGHPVAPGRLARLVEGRA